MIEPLPLERRGPRVARAQTALELSLIAYAIIGSLIVGRFLIRIMSVHPHLGLSETILLLSDPLVWPMELMPAAERPLIAGVTLPDITLIAVLILIPLWLLARPGRMRQ